MFGDFYRDKRVLVTGHTGFKGGWLSLWLHRLGASVSGLGLKPPTDPSLYEIIRAGTFAGETECDIRDYSTVERTVKEAAPHVLFHLAAQPLVRRSYVRPLETLEVNTLGTANVLEAVRRAELPCIVVVVTTDKCYENRNWEFGYRETDPLGGHDTYSMSKAAAELVVDSWRKSFFLPNPKLGNVATVRAGNVLGGGDYGENRIVPDAIRALLQKSPIPVRNPSATRPWQHVLDCLSGYLWLGARLAQEEKATRLASAFNFGPDFQANITVAELVEAILRHWPGEWKSTGEANAPHEAGQLHLAIDKAAALLPWRPTWGCDMTIRQTVEWYRERHVAANPKMRELSVGQIDRFMEDAASQAQAWANSQIS